MRIVRIAAFKLQAFKRTVEVQGRINVQTRAFQIDKDLFFAFFLFMLFFIVILVFFFLMAMFMTAGQAIFAFKAVDGEAKEATLANEGQATREGLAFDIAVGQCAERFFFAFLFVIMIFILVMILVMIFVTMLFLLF